MLAFAGKHKIADKFEQQAYKVISQPHSDIPVFVVKAEDGSEKRLHRNHLIPIEVVDNVEEKGRPAGPVVEEVVDDVIEEVVEDDVTEEVVEDDVIEEVVEDGVIGEAREDEETDVDMAEVNEPHAHSADAVAEGTEKHEEVGRVTDGLEEAIGRPLADPPPPQPPPRHSTRPKRKPAWQKDYVVSRQQTVRKIEQEKVELKKLLKEQTLLKT